MPVEGLQTHDFVQRLERSRATLPPLLLELSEVLVQMIDDIEYPTPADISRLHSRIREIVQDKQQLASTCGTEGKLCVICPYTAFIPSEFPFASQQVPVCLPWISVNR